MDYDDGDTPVDLDQVTEAEILAAEALVDDVRELTPTVQFVCRECGGRLERIEEWRPPEDAAGAWREWHMACVTPPSRDWSFCCVTGGCWVADVRYDFGRRKVRTISPTWNGVCRRSVSR